MRNLHDLPRVRLGVFPIADISEMCFAYRISIPKAYNAILWPVICLQIQNAKHTADFGR